MQKIVLYRTIKENGIVSVSPIKPKKHDSISYRIIADDKKELVCDNIRTYCVDTNNPDKWIEENEVIIDDYTD